MDILLSDLRQITESLFAHLEETGIETIRLQNDYYWHISGEELFDPYKVPSELNLGQLSDDWRDLQNVADGKSDPLLSDFNDLAAVLRAIGELGEDFLFTRE